MDEPAIGKHTQELLDMRPEAKPVVDALVSRGDIKRFFSEKGSEGYSRFELLLMAKFKSMLDDPKSITPDMLKLISDVEKSDGDDTSAVLRLFINLNEKPVEVVEAKTK